MHLLVSIWMLPTIHCINQNTLINISESISNIAYESMLSQISHVPSDGFFKWIHLIDFNFRKSVPALIASGLNAFDHPGVFSLESRDHFVNQTLHQIQSEFISISKQTIHYKRLSKRYLFTLVLTLLQRSKRCRRKGDPIAQDTVG